MSAPRIALVTAPDEATAAQLATTLIEERLAACVNLLPGVRSLYRWEGKIADEREWLMIVKTTADNVERLIARVVALHPYDTPEVVTVAIDEGAIGYLGWLADACGPG